MNTANTVQEWLAGVDRRHAERRQYVARPEPTGFGELDAIAEKREAAASECRQEAARERDAQRDEQMYGRLG